MKVWATREVPEWFLNVPYAVTQVKSDHFFNVAATASFYMVSDFATFSRADDKCQQAFCSVHTFTTKISWEMKYYTYIFTKYSFQKVNSVERISEKNLKISYWAKI